MVFTRTKNVRDTGSTKYDRFVPEALLNTTKQIGQLAEDQACNYLVQQGLRLVTRNYRCRLGEIDLILWDKTNLVFAEVRFRKHAHFGHAADTVTYYKQRKIIKTALHYLQCYPCDNPCRFDVVAVTPRVDKTSGITWIRDAFRVE